MLKWTVGNCLACKACVFCGANDDTIYVANALPPSWTLKLTENWGKTKKDFKGEVALPSSLSFLICLQAGARDQCTSALSLKKIHLLYRPVKANQSAGRV